MSAAAGAWLVEQDHVCSQTQTGSVILVTEGPKVVAYFHVESVRRDDDSGSVPMRRTAAIPGGDESAVAIDTSDRPRTPLTFGSSAGIEEVAERISRVLDIVFELRESMYFGGDYYRSTSVFGEVIVQRNGDLGEPAEPAHPDLSTLVRVEVAAALELEVVTVLQPLGLIMVHRTA